jgi:hypothetical protein
MDGFHTRSETLFCLFLFLGTLCTARLYRTLSAQWACLGGMMLTVATLIKPSSICLALLGALIPLYYGISRLQWRSALAGVVLILTGNSLVFGWILRNGQVAGEYVLTSIPRYQLLNEHAAWALSRAKNISPEIARRGLTASIGLTPGQVRYAPLSADQERRIRNIARETIRENVTVFLHFSLIRSINVLFGPDKNILRAPGLPPVSFGFMGDRYASPRNSLLAWLFLIPQCVHLSVVYVLVVRSLVLFTFQMRVHVLAGVCLLFAVCLLGLSLGAPGDPRYRWPVVPLLIILGAATLVDPRKDDARDTVTHGRCPTRA